MNVFKLLGIIAVASLAIPLFGCSDANIPEVNDTNCKIKNIKKIEDRAMQQEFARKCLRRGGFKESSGEGFTVQ